MITIIFVYLSIELKLYSCFWVCCWYEAIWFYFFWKTNIKLTKWENRSFQILSKICSCSKLCLRGHYSLLNSFDKYLRYSEQLPPINRIMSCASRFSNKFYVTIPVQCYWETQLNKKLCPESWRCELIYRIFLVQGEYPKNLCYFLLLNMFWC